MVRSKITGLIHTARCERCDREVLRALVRPKGELARRFVDLVPTPLGYAPDDHDREMAVRATGVRTFMLYLGIVSERDGTPGRIPGRLFAQHWCSPPEDQPLGSRSFHDTIGSLDHLYSARAA